MDKLKSVLFDRYTLTLKHEYEFEKNGNIRRVKADEPLCISCAMEYTGRTPALMFINDMVDMIKAELLKRMTEE